jgi:hypothetical protein
MTGQPDFTAIYDLDVRERYRLGHHPRRTAVAPVADTPTGWYRSNGRDLYRADERLIYRVDLIDGMFQVYKVDWRPEASEYFRGNFGPQLKTWIGAKTLVEADVHKQMKGKR